MGYITNAGTAKFNGLIVNGTATLIAPNTTTKPLSIKNTTAAEVLYVTPSGDLVSRSVTTFGLYLADGTNTNATISQSGDIVAKTLSISGSVSGAGLRHC